MYYDIKMKFTTLTKKHEKMKATLEDDLANKKKQLADIKI